MTLEKILGSEYSFAEGEIEHAIRRILKEVQDHWGIKALKDDLLLVMTQSEHRDAEGELFDSYFFHFDATPTLIDKFYDNPEALI